MNGKELRTLFVMHARHALSSYEEMPVYVQREYDDIADEVTETYIAPLQGRIEKLESDAAMHTYVTSQIVAGLEQEKQALQALAREYRALAIQFSDALHDGAGDETGELERVLEVLEEKAQALLGEQTLC